MSTKRKSLTTCDRGATVPNTLKKILEQTAPHLLECPDAAFAIRDFIFQQPNKKKRQALFQLLIDASTKQVGDLMQTLVGLQWIIFSNSLPSDEALDQWMLANKKAHWQTLSDSMSNDYSVNLTKQLKRLPYPR